MQSSIRQKLRQRQRRIERRLQRKRRRDAKTTGFTVPVLDTRNLDYDLSDRSRGLAYGGIALFHRLADDVGLTRALDDRLHLLRLHLPYHESDHVLNFAFNALCDGVCLQDMELRRTDESYLDALGAETTPDPTTAGDFCRRFRPADLRDLHDAIDVARREVWRRQPLEFFDEAIVEADGTYVLTTGECKQGMEINHKSQWGYHPLIVSLANTKEVLSLVNRPGNRPSHEGVVAEFDRAIALCRQAGFRGVRLRGDTDFSLTEHFERWDQDGVRFEFGYDADPNLIDHAERLPSAAWTKLQRPPRYVAAGPPRQRPPKVKRQIIRRREFLHKQLHSEEVAEFAYRPTNCKRSYRMIVVKKNVSQERGEHRLFDELRYFFYVTNDPTKSAPEVVFSCNDRCDQENLIAQLAGGVRALSAPLDNLTSNGAFMVMTGLAWTLKSWAALLLPIEPQRRAQHTAERRTLLTMEFRRFVNLVVKLPCQLVERARRTVLRIWGYNAFLPVFFRLWTALRC